MDYVIFDIETGPDEGFQQFKPEFKAPSNYKTPDAIAKSIAEQEEDWASKAALSALTGKVLAIGFETPAGKSILCSDDEAEIISSFWEKIAPRGTIVQPVIGFYSNLFDLPFLARRSWKLGVEVPRTLFSGRYLNNQCKDIAELWQCGNRQAHVNLDHLALYLGIGRKNGKGADFAALLREDRVKALEYLANDLDLTTKAAARLGLIVLADEGQDELDLPGAKRTKKDTLPARANGVIVRLSCDKKFVLFYEAENQGADDWFYCLSMENFKTRKDLGSTLAHLSGKHWVTPELLHRLSHLVTVGVFEN